MKVVYFSGGVGGARLLDGIARAMPPADLAAIVNVGDDFEHLGLTICPDIDSVLYTLSGLGDEARGWGLAHETFRALDMIGRYRPEERWFQLGDQDLGTHLARRQWLTEGVSLTDVTSRLACGIGVEPRILPASDGSWRTFMETEQDGTLPFQEWLVRRRAAPLVRAVRFEGSGVASEAALAAIDEAELLVIGPSNPYVSIDPILALPGMRERFLLRAASVPVVAVSPIVGGRAVKGPLAAMIPRLAERPASAAAVAAHYGSVLHGMVVEQGDEAELQRELPVVEVLATRTVMKTRDERVKLAEQVLALGQQLVSRSGR
jgi:LPPG:FO 2-phospho-L-lactate transferase